MNCPKCGQRTRVVDSRHPDSKISVRWRWSRPAKSLVAFGQKWVGWWSQDWVVRRRNCPCGKTYRTIELLEEDLPTLMKRHPDDPTFDQDEPKEHEPDL